MRSRFTLVTPPESAEPVYFDPRPELPAVPRRLPPSEVPGDARIGAVANYFTLNGVVCGIGASFAWLSLIVSAILPFHWDAPANQVFLGAVLGTMMCVANLRTAHLLGERKRSGALLALGYCAATLAGIGHSGFSIGVVFSAIGLVFVASLWKYLD
jgi:hypothetical protein